MVRPQPPMRSDSRGRRPSHLPLGEFNSGCLLAAPRYRSTSDSRDLIQVNLKSAVSSIAGGELLRLPPGPTWERLLSLAIGFDCVGDENAGAQQAKQSCCFEHGVYSRTEGAEI